MSGAGRGASAAKPSGALSGGPTLRGRRQPAQKTGPTLKLNTPVGCRSLKA